MKHCIVIFLLFFGLYVQAQVAINTNGANPAASAMLDVSSTSKGVLITRLTTAQRKAVPAPEVGLLVFDTDRQTIYVYDGQKWKPMLTATESNEPLSSRKIEDVAVGTGTGNSVALDDNFAAVGVPLDSAKGVEHCGAVYIFTKQDGAWVRLQKISAPNGVAFDMFGAAVSISGDVLVVGAPKRAVGGQLARGVAYVYKRQNRSWTLQVTLTASNGAAFDYFGSAVTNTNEYIAVGAPNRSNNAKLGAGAVYLYGLQNGAWAQKTILTDNNPVAGAEFGFSLTIWQKRLIVGAPAAEAFFLNTPTNGGALYFYENTDAAGFNWPLKQKIISPYTHDKMRFGHSVAMEADKFVVGAPGYSGEPWSSVAAGIGSAFKYVFENGSWKAVYVQLGEYYNEFAHCGTSVAITNGMAMAGVPAWRNGRGKVLMDYYPPRSVYDEDPNVEYEFGSAMAAHNRQFVIVRGTGYVRVFFGAVE